MLYILDCDVGQYLYPRYIVDSVAQATISAECENMDSTVKRGDIFYADLSPVVGSEQGGTRPVLIVQNDMGNRHSPTVIAAAITSQTRSEERRVGKECRL